MNRLSNQLLAIASLTLIAVLGGCAGRTAHDEGSDLFLQGRHSEGLARLEEATRQAPDNATFRMAYQNARQRLIARWLGEAEVERAAGRFASARARIADIQAIEPDNREAASQLARIEQTLRHQEKLAEAEALFASDDAPNALLRVREILQEDPSHSAAQNLHRQLVAQSTQSQLVTQGLHGKFQETVTLEFQDANVKQVLEALSRVSGLNFILDKEVPVDLMVTVFLKNVRLIEALDLILATNQLKYRVLNPSSVLIFPDTAAKLSEHQNLIVRTFFLANADAKQVMTMLTGVLKAKNVYADEKLNLLIMRDTPEMIELGERLVATQDVAEPEVMLDVEVLEMKRTQLMNLGIQWPDQLTLAPLPLGDNLTLRELRDLNSSRIGASISPLTINLHDDIGNANLLANPRIRTHNREKATIRIGDRVPVITNTSTATGFVAESVQYIDVGLKLEVEPVIYPDNQVSIKLSLEVSSVLKEIVSKTGSVSYQIGARTASTVLRLRDGETQVLGGLINDEDRKTANRFPGLGTLPILNTLFASQSDNNQKTELVLSIRPRIVRNLAPPADLPDKFWSGTESTPALRQPHLTAPSAP
jgi:general secretion pathway protein D